MIYHILVDVFGAMEEVNQRSAWVGELNALSLHMAPSTQTFDSNFSNHTSIVNNHIPYLNQLSNSKKYKSTCK